MLVKPKYDPRYVNRLYANLRALSTVDFKFHVLTDWTEDHFFSDIRVHKLPTWLKVSPIKAQWFKLAWHGFSALDNQKCLILDIDMIPIGNMDSILSTKLTGGALGVHRRWWSSRQNDCPISGGFQMFYQGETSHLWHTFMNNPSEYMERYIRDGKAEGPINGEQNFVYEHIGEKNLHWFPAHKFGKYERKTQAYIEKRWNAEFDRSDNFYYFGGEFNPDVRLIHFANHRNMLHDRDEQWITESWEYGTNKLGLYEKHPKRTL